MVVGVKRKHPDDHGDAEEMEAGKAFQQQALLSQTNLCQTLLQLSIDKFQLGPPSLLRQVLITNTLNHIREKMNLERGPMPPQGPELELFLPLTAQVTNSFLRELEAMGLRITKDCCESPEMSCSSTSVPDQLSDCRQIPSLPGASVSPFVRVEEPILGSVEITSDRYLGDLVPDDFFPDIDTSDMERDTWPSASALAASSGTTSSPGQPGVEWDWTELDQILEIIKGS
ncbi:SERTA domain-containing protein 3 isoform X2 [Macrotis lagotis]